MMFLLIALLAVQGVKGADRGVVVGGGKWVEVEEDRTIEKVEVKDRFEFPANGSPKFKVLDNTLQVTFNLTEDNRNLHDVSVWQNRKNKEDSLEDIYLGNMTKMPKSEEPVQILTNINACETYTRLYIKYETPDVKKSSIWFEYNQEECASSSQLAMYGALVPAVIVLLGAAALVTACHRRRRRERITSVQANPQYGRYSEDTKETELYDRNIDYYGADSGIEIWVADSNPAYRR
jgi:hypothetical protein